jgi:hypothetical protein
MSASPPRMAGTGLVLCGSMASTRSRSGDTKYRSETIPETTKKNPTIDTVFLRSPCCIGTLPGLETCESCGKDQEIYFRLGQRPIIGQCCIQAHRPVSTTSRRRVQDGNCWMACHPQMTSSFEALREIRSLWRQNLNRDNDCWNQKDERAAGPHERAAHSWSWSAETPKTLGAER